MRTIEREIYHQKTRRKRVERVYKKGLREEIERERDKERTPSAPQESATGASRIGGYTFPPPKRPTPTHHTYSMGKIETSCG